MKPLGGFLKTTYAIVTRQDGAVDDLGEPTGRAWVATGQVAYGTDTPIGTANVQRAQLLEVTANREAYLLKPAIPLVPDATRLVRGEETFLVKDVRDWGGLVVALLEGV